MFFGQEVKANQNKASAMTMDTDVKLSQAVLDPATKGNKKEPVCLMAEIQGKSFILAVLDPSQSWQCPLDLMLAAGTEVKFFLRGQGTVHLTGYEFLDDDDNDFELSMSSDDEMEEAEDEDDNEQSPDEAESKHLAKKIKTKNSPATNGVGNKHHAARMKPSGDDNQMQDSDDDDSDDEDLSFGSGDEDDDDDDDEEDNSDMDDVDLDELSSDDGLDEDDEQEDEEDDSD